MHIVTARKRVRAKPDPALRHPTGAYCFCCKELTEPVFVEFGYGSVCTKNIGVSPKK
jgi:hypothetical protein